MNDTAQVVATDYWQSYQLQYDPFESAIVEQTFTDIAQWEEDLDLLQHLCRYSNVLTCITGDTGIGKTTLMEEFFSQVGESMRVYQINADEQLDPRQLLQVISDGFSAGNEFEPDTTLRSCFDQQLEKIQSSEQICLLLIDNAETLPSDTLEALFYLISEQSDVQKRFHIVLFSTPNLYNDLTMIAEQQAYVDKLHHIALKPFTLEDTKAYIQHRLRLAGLKSELPLSDTVISRIYRLSNGYPARINRLAQQHLQERLENRNKKSRAFWLTNQNKLVGCALVVIAITFFSILLVENSNDQSPQLGLAQLKPLPTAKLPQFAEAKLPSQRLLQKQLDSDLTNNQDFFITQADTPAQTTTEPEKQQLAQREFTPPVETQQNVQQELPSLPVTKVTAPVKSLQLAASISQQQTVKQALGGDATGLTPKKAVPLSTNTSQQKTVVTQLVQVKPQAATNQHHFTLQILGVKTQKQIDRFIKQYKLTGKVTAYKTKLKGEDWYVLGFGTYKNRDQAKAAIKQLPKGIQHIKPWPRRFSSIHISNVSQQVAKVNKTVDKNVQSAIEG